MRRGASSASLSDQRRGYVPDATQGYRWWDAASARRKAWVVGARGTTSNHRTREQPPSARASRAASASRFTPALCRSHAGSASLARDLQFDVLVPRGSVHCPLVPDTAHARVGANTPGSWRQTRKAERAVRRGVRIDHELTLRQVEARAYGAGQPDNATGEELPTGRPHIDRAPIDGRVQTAGEHVPACDVRGQPERQRLVLQLAKAVGVALFKARAAQVVGTRSRLGVSIDDTVVV